MNLLGQMAGADLHRCGNDASDDSMIHWMRRLGGRCAGSHSPSRRQDAQALHRYSPGGEYDGNEYGGLPAKLVVFVITLHYNVIESHTFADNRRWGSGTGSLLKRHDSQQVVNGRFVVPFARARVRRVTFR
jgi:hypothetical protein